MHHTTKSLPIDLTWEQEAELAEEADRAYRQLEILNYALIARLDDPDEAESFGQALSLAFIVLRKVADRGEAVARAKMLQTAEAVIQ